MKTNFLFSLFIITIFFSSCSSLLDLQKRKYRSGYRVDFVSSKNSALKTLATNDSLPAKTQQADLALIEPKMKNADSTQNESDRISFQKSPITAAETSSAQKQAHTGKRFLDLSNKTILHDTTKTVKKKSRWSKRPVKSHDEKIKDARRILWMVSIMMAVFFLLALIGFLAVGGFNFLIGLLIVFGLELFPFALGILIYLLVLLHQKKTEKIPDPNDPAIIARRRKILLGLLIVAYLFALLSLNPMIYAMAIFAILFGIAALIFRKKTGIKSIAARIAAFAVIIAGFVIGYMNTRV